MLKATAWQAACAPFTLGFEVLEEGVGVEADDEKGGGEDDGGDFFAVVEVFESV